MPEAVADRWPRVILHADMDAFYAAVEQRDRPELRGKPVIVGFPSPRSVVSTASYEARPFGVGSAMPMVRAMRLCPDAVVVPPRMGHYAKVSGEIMSVFDTFSPRVEPLSLDEAFLDMTGAEKLFGPPEAMGFALQQAVWQATGLTISVGVASSKYVAKVASDLRKPCGLVVVPPAETLSFLAGLPVSRLWGVGQRGQQVLARLGLATIADVAAADPAWLERELGSLGPHIHRLALGQDPRPVVPDREAHSIGSEETLATDVRGAAAIAPLLLHAADRVAYRLRRAGLLAGGLRVKLKTSRFALHTRQQTLHPPCNHADDLHRAAVGLLPAFDLGEAMRLVGLAAYDLRPVDAPRQQDLFLDAPRRRSERLDKAVDALKARFGHAAVQRASDLGAAGRASGLDGEEP